ncbi:hypothetical protein AX17_002749 [Amanita inopinata Kibby_2008]|nr:hypothetical protein AX17_002749 [Amanita inopinata Kibby_2008]
MGVERLTPVGVDHFSHQEQFLVLKKGEKVNGRVYPTWDESTPVSSSSSSSSSSPPPDVHGYHPGLDDQPLLSPEQVRQDPVWRRPDVPTVSRLQRVLPQEILQHIVTDCSLCASITVCLEHARRFNSNLLQGSLHTCPMHPSAVQLCGKYWVRVLFNGIWRRIVIDDRLPYHKKDGTLLCMSVIPRKDEPRREREINWPSLIEKAYMRLMGGYDFPGSISSADLHALAGWIPEHIDVKSPDFEREKTWARVLRGFLSGQCMVTVGTGPATYCCWRETRLLPSHCYPVVDVGEGQEGPIMTVLNSWVQGSNGDHLSHSRHLCIPWSEVISTFNGVYLSWDPKRWAKNLTFHGMWKRRGQDEQSSTSRLRLIYNNASTDKYIWVLLTRHVIDTKRTSDYVSLRAEPEDEALEMTGHMAQQTLTEKGTFTNSIHVLAKIRLRESSGALIVTAAYDGDATEVGYTIDAYAGQGVVLTWDENISAPPYIEKVTGTFTSKNSGGNGTYPTFMLNPQYHLRIHPPKGSASSSASRRKVRATIVLKSEREVPVNVALTWSQGERKYSLSENELAATSGPYSYGLATITNDLGPGDYTLIVSAFEPRYMGAFSLTVSVSSPLDLKPIPQEGAGMYKKDVKGEWTAATAGGSPSSERYMQNPVYDIEVPSQAQLKLRLQLVNPASAVPMNITLYPASADGSLKQQKLIATSGPYDDAIAGVAIPQFSLNAGKYWAVPSTYSPAIRAEFQLIVYSSVAGVVVESRR